jgi:nucleosome binding factor SPN SPT16 subunit
MIVLVHFHLKNPIMIGKKKTKDVQFYREAMEAIADETGSRRRRMAFGDEDEIMQEQEEKRQRAALNHEFKQFCEKIEAACGKDVHVDVPIRELGFYGVPFRQSVLLQPTGNCLVYLSDPPFLMISLTDIELASLERVHFGLKNFDLVFVFKDHTISPQHIDAIPMTYLEHVKDWLDSSDVYFITSNINFNWTNIMKTVVSDPVGFYELGGWEMIHNNPDKPAASDEDEDTEDSVYEEDDEKDEEDDDYSEEDDGDEEEDEEDDDYSEEDDDYSEEDEEDEEGMDWDELEKETIKEEKRARNAPTAPAKRKR